MRTRRPAVYILASRRNGTLYTGVTSNLEERVYRHKNRYWRGFTTWYGVRMLVYFEMHASMRDAIAREKRVKHWSRVDKLSLIESMNPEWKDLAEDWYS